MTQSTDIAQVPASAMEGCHTSGGVEESATQVLLALVPLVINPIQLAIIEALTWINRPLSATQLTHALNGLGGKKGTYPGLMSYHLRALMDFGVLEIARTRSVRGTTETFFFFRCED